jgi:carboxylate-amine ligase
MTHEPPTATRLRRAFDDAGGFTIGLEEELMLLDPVSLDLAPRAAEMLELTAGDPRFKLELPASQLEIVLPPQPTVTAAARELASARAELAAALAGEVRLATAGLHPTAAPEGELSRGPRYDRTAAEFGVLARRQLVFALQVHVAVGGADRSLAVYNGLRSRLPELAALAANAPFHAGRDTGMASARPAVARALPRQGVPPAFESWDDYARALRWGAAAGAVPEPGTWWWELRPHPLFGTLELRVADAQTTVAEAAAVVAVAVALVRSLADRHDAGERLPAVPRWRIEENAWSAARRGLDAELADLETGTPEPARELLRALLEEVAPAAAALGCEAELALAAELVEENGAMRQRAVAAAEGLDAVPAWLAGRWLEAVDEAARG